MKHDLARRSHVRVPQPRIPRSHRIDVDQARLVAGAFLDARQTSNDPVVVAAYSSLAAQADQWYGRITNASARRSVRVVHTRCREPYATGWELAEQVRASRVLELWPAQYDRDRPHPRLDMSVGGTYDRFRAVHDIVSHAWCGFGFDRNGEFSAWLAEDRMYTGVARWALATELHAEHCVRWTTGHVAEHKATLLPSQILSLSRRVGQVAHDE